MGAGGKRGGWGQGGASRTRTFQLVADGVGEGLCELRAVGLAGLLRRAHLQQVALVQARGQRFAHDPLRGAPREMGAGGLRRHTVGVVSFCFCGLRSTFSFYPLDASH